MHYCAGSPHNHIWLRTIKGGRQWRQKAGGHDGIAFFYTSCLNVAYRLGGESLRLGPAAALQQLEQAVAKRALGHQHGAVICAGSGTARDCSS